MTRIWPIFSVLLPLSCLVASPLAAEDSRQEKLTRGNTAFALEMYRNLAAQEGNLFFSPYSVSAALAMTQAGARGATERQMAEILHFEPGQAELHHTFGDVNRQLTATARDSGQKLNIANALVLTGGGIVKDYKDLLKKTYDAEVFRGNLAAINAWVLDKSEGRIEKILEELSRDSVCTILNAVYFKGSWQNRFPKEDTVDAPFQVS
ncbi:MAG: serpin family protein, partial [Desulfuromonadaceae bacterium]|nr:serpin family protein [Desulfuromonadaceae bacterium]